MEIFQSLWQILVNLGALAVGIVTLGIHWFALVAWLAWWLFGVNWRKVWPVLSGGGWVPFVLLIILGAAAWAALQPVPCSCLKDVPPFWSHLGAVGLLAGITLLCGWLQGLLQWAPADINLDPPTAPAHAHGHH